MEGLNYSGFDARLKEASQQFERVSLRRKGNALYIRGQFPPKPGEFQSSRRDLPTGCNATPAGLKVAIAKAKEIDSQLLWGKFDWLPHLKGSKAKPEIASEWVDQYEDDHWQHTERTPKKESSFQSCYRHYFGLLPRDAVLTIGLLQETIVTRSKPASRSRELCCMAFGSLVHSLPLDMGRSLLPRLHYSKMS